jgi:proteasome lid subunit RPN8/RPN11
MQPGFELVTPDSILLELRQHAAAEHPLECCGVLAGRDGTVSLRFPIRNDASSPTAYVTNGRDLLDAQKMIRSAGLVELAIYHSHPDGEAIPSRTDLDRNTWGDSVAHVIVGRDAIRAWRLLPDHYEEVPIKTVP